jgi:hypothetical protein
VRGKGLTTALRATCSRPESLLTEIAISLWEMVVAGSTGDGP